MLYTKVIFKEGHPYVLKYSIGVDGTRTVLSEERVQLAYETGPEKYVGAACRLCGLIWSLPKHYERSISAERGWECPTCRRKYEQKD